MLLADWIEQPLVNQRITIRTLIKSVADKEVAHSDPELNETLAFLKSVLLRSTGADAEFIGSIGHYILRNLIGRRCMEIGPELLARYRDARTQHGPGALRLDLPAAQRPYSQGLDVSYKTAVEARTTTKDAALGERAAKIMESYPEDASFPLWLIDLQAHVWFMRICADDDVAATL